VDVPSEKQAAQAPEVHPERAALPGGRPRGRFRSAAPLPRGPPLPPPPRRRPSDDPAHPETRARPRPFLELEETSEICGPLDPSNSSRELENQHLPFPRATLRFRAKGSSRPTSR
jgi:hypothetical protein